MSYDDGQAADRRLVEIFNRYGIKCTFNLSSSFLQNEDFVSAEEVRTLYDGHEVACHTVDHPTISRCPLSQTVRQILDDRENLEQITGYPVRGLAYPMGSNNKQIREILEPLGIEYARVVGSTGAFDLPEDLYRWQGTCHHNQNLLENAKRFMSLNKKQYLYLMYVWGHSYEFDHDNNWELIEDFCRLLSKNTDIWYATNIEIVDYLNLFRRLQFSCKCDFVYNPSIKSAYLTVDGAPIEIPGGVQTRLF